MSWTHQVAYAVQWWTTPPATKHKLSSRQRPCSFSVRRLRCVAFTAVWVQGGECVVVQSEVAGVEAFDVPVLEGRLRTGGQRYEGLCREAPMWGWSGS